MIKILDDNFDKNIFNSKAVHPMQMWQWGDITSKKMGNRVIRLAEFEKNRLKNVYQIDVLNLYLFKNKFFPYKVGFLPRSTMPTKEFLNFLYDYGIKNNLVMVKIEPYILRTKDRLNISDDHIKIIKSPSSIISTWTQFVDLSKSEEQLLKDFHYKTRYNIRLAQKKGVKVKEVNNKRGLEQFIKLYSETFKRKNLRSLNSSYHRFFFDVFKKDFLHLLIAYSKNEPLAAFELLDFKNTLHFVFGGTSDKHHNLMASNLLMWETIRLGKKLGLKKLDMWGSLPPDYNNPDHSWSGLTRFKQGYGTSFVKLAGSYDFAINKQKYYAVVLMNKLKTVVHRII